MLGNTKDRYGLAARLLHWSIAALVLGLIWLGWWMMGLGYYDPGTTPPASGMRPSALSSGCSACALPWATW